jgi:hypothetical protein
MPASLGAHLGDYSSEHKRNMQVKAAHMFDAVRAEVVTLYDTQCESMLPAGL